MSDQPITLSEYMQVSDALWQIESWLAQRASTNTVEAQRAVRIIERTVNAAMDAQQQEAKHG